MSDETTEVEKTEESTTTEATEETTSTEDAAYDKDRAMRTINTLREKEKEGKRVAKELADARKKLQEFEDAQKSDADKQAERLAALEAENAQSKTMLREKDLRLAVYGRQAELGLVDADLAIAALDKDKVEWSDDGSPSNLDDLLNDLMERKPLLKGKAAKPKGGGTDARDGASGGPKPNLDAGQLAMAQKLAMSPEDYAKWQGVQTIDDYEKTKQKDTKD